MMGQVMVITSIHGNNETCSASLKYRDEEVSLQTRLEASKGRGSRNVLWEFVIFNWSKVREGTCPVKLSVMFGG